ncbi:MAG: hypothetical protein GKR89_27905 [Candidatus Latescibacteria bacterium]|nr:hypothetical protein [Candidatus Latescibacterota bacterium]
MSYLSAVFISALLFHSGCGQNEDVAIVAEVGPYTIDAELVRAFVEDLPQGLRTRKTGDEARHHYLQSLVDRRLLLLEAQVRGLDTTRAVQQEVADAIDGRVRNLYRMRHIVPEARVEEEEIRRYFSAEGFDRERQVSAILVESRAQIDSIAQQLQAGGDFEEIARAHSLDQRSANQGGKLGFVGAHMAPRMHIPSEVFKSLPLNQISQPIPAGPNWHVVRFVAERQATYDDYRSVIERILFEERLVQIEREHLDLLRESMQVRLHGAVLRQLVQAYRQQDLAPIAGSTEELYTFEGGAVRLGQVYEELVRRHVKYGLADSLQAARTLDSHFFSAFIVQEAARRAGIYDEPEMLDLARRTQEEALLEKLRKTGVLEQIELPAEEVRQYYDQHSEKFTEEGAVWVEEVLLPTLSEAEQVRQLIEAGTGFADLAQRSQRSDAVKYSNRFHFHARGRIRYPRLIPAVLGAPQGQLSGPLEVEGGFSVFRVLQHEEPGVRPFDQAQRQARGFLRIEKEQRKLQELMTGVRAQYVDQVRIYEGNLVRALPDSLLLSEKK